MNYFELREKFHRFYYRDFEMIEDESVFSIHYHFEIEGLSSFKPTFTIKKPNNKKVYSNYRLIKEAAFSLGMVELISYWKTACPKEVIVECSSLTEEQIAWWKKLYFHGLGEFFYLNHISSTIDDFMILNATGETLTGETYQPEYQGNLIPVGGGKDSFVSLEILKDQFHQNHAFIINRVLSAIHSAEAAGYTGEKCICATRTLDSRMLELNQQGYLNGHTPFSAMAAFASYLTALIYEKKYICLSNEASANESTVKDSKINHQYSKSFEFEVDFNQYIRKYLSAEPKYFSLLRPLSELQIAAIFSTLTPYLHVFRSCNVGQKTESWCGYCAKCLFVYIMLSAFLDNETLISIFGRDMLNDSNMMELFEQLTGISDNKPFECVGTRDEVNLAISMSIRRYQKNHKELPFLYQQFQKSSYYFAYQDKKEWIDEWNQENFVPEFYAEKIKQRLAGIKICIY